MSSSLATIAFTQELDARSLYEISLEKMISSDYYGAIENLLLCIKKSPSYAEALLSLSECYYEIGEYEQAKSYILQAKKYKSNDANILNQEAMISIVLKDIEGAETIYKSILNFEPNNINAQFGLAQIDIARGKTTSAKNRYLQTLQYSPGNAKALLSLAAVNRDLKNPEGARVAIAEALRNHGQDSQVQYFAALLSKEDGDYTNAVSYCLKALELSPKYLDALKLLSSLYYKTADYVMSEKTCEVILYQNRKDPEAWFTLALSRIAQKNKEGAISAIKTCMSLKPDDEFYRLVYENIAFDFTELEDRMRVTLSDNHFQRAYANEERSYFDQALFEYKRALKIYPYAKTGRERYAQLLKRLGTRARYLFELKFIKELGMADTKILDAIEIYTSILQDTISAKWNIDQFSIRKDRYKISYFFINTSGTQYHTDSDAIITRYFNDICLQSRVCEPLSSVAKVANFAEAYRNARSSESDFFIIIRVNETERDIQIEADMHSSKSGTLLSNFSAYRTGNDRVKNTVKRIQSLIEEQLPFRSIILERKQNTAIIDKGSQDGLKIGDVFTIIKKDSAKLKPDAIQLGYDPRDIIGTITITALDEELAEGTLLKEGFYDMMNISDSIISLVQKKNETVIKDPNFPGLFDLIKQIR